MNIEARERELKSRAADLKTRLEVQKPGTSIATFKAFEAHCARWDADRKKLDADKFGMLRAFGRSLGNDSDEMETKAMTGAQLNPARFSEDSLRVLHKARTSRQSVSVKAFTTIDTLLPAQLAPYPVGKIHEHRVACRFPPTSISAPSYEFIFHSSTTGAPGVVSEGGTKPEVVLNATSSIATVVKLALNLGISYETLQDWPQWFSYCQVEAMKELVDLENTQLLSGSGTGGNMTGFLNTSGILTHNFATDPSGTTSLDAVELSIAQLRVGSALAEPDLLVLHPQTWAAMRRIKTTVGEYIIQPDPTRGAVDTLWGVDVLVTTAQAAGVGLLLDTTKAGYVLLREGISVHMGYSGTDFVQNISRMTMEERLTLAVERPSAVLAISGLPTS